jgi:N-acetylglucosaminyldiphosphoundecaprenol N-acetyl-beta-D-mannosaminyltransferase
VPNATQSPTAISSSRRRWLPKEPGETLQDSCFHVLGVRIHNVTRRRGIELIEQAIRRREKHAHSIFFTNAHTLNLAHDDPAFRRTLNAADYVFGDGTGVRWAARLQGVRVADNLVGTDFVPTMFETTAGRGYSYFLLGSDTDTIATAASYARERFPGWASAGHHHGYLADEPTANAAIDQINVAAPDVLLVGMGNPLQEEWILAHRHRLRAPVCMGIGGLFDYWADNVTRAPLWLRKAGHEWLWRLYQQPRLKAKRYLIGNPLFLARILRERRRKATDDDG